MHVWEPEKAQFNGLDQKLYEDKECEDSICDREDYVEDQEIKLESKEEQLNQLLKHWKRKRTKLSLRKRQVEKDEDGIDLTGRTDGQRATITERAQELREQEEVIAGDGF